MAGSADPKSWVFRLDLAGPSGGETRLYPSAAVLNFRYAPEPKRPWSSPSPLGYARATARLAANLELRLGEEASASVGSLLPPPSDGGDGDVDDPLAGLKSDLKNLQGNTALVETTSAGFGEGRAAAPQAAWQVKRLGANPPQTLNELRGAAGVDVLAACGVPPGLADGGAEGGGQREAWRRFSVGTLQPAARLVGQEMAFKLNVPGLRLHFEGLASADLAGKSRAVGSFVKSGVPLARALELAGLRG